MIVVDSNVIVYLHIASEFSHLAEQAWAKDHNWISTPLWRSEMRNVLTQYIRRRLLSLEAATSVVAEALKSMAGLEHDVDSSHVLRLAAASTCSAYDCEFVALAQDLGVPLVTVDKKILAQFPDVAIALDKYVGI